MFHIIVVFKLTPEEKKKQTKSYLWFLLDKIARFSSKHALLLRCTEQHFSSCKIIQLLRSEPACARIRTNV